MKGKKLARRIALALAVLLALYLAAVVVPYALPRQVGDDFWAGFSADAFYGDGTLSGPDRAGYVGDPQQAFALRLALIASAQERIDISSYSTDPGETTALFWGALLDAADRGVAVRIVLDEMFSGLKGEEEATAAALWSHPNIELYYFNPFSLLRPAAINSRLHDKYFIVDEKVMLLGGRNIADNYFAPDSYEGAVSRDHDVLVWHAGEGESVIADVLRYCDGVCESGLTVPAFDRLSERQLSRAQARGDELRLLYSGCDVQQAPDDEQLRSMTAATDKISLISNPVTAEKKEPLILAQLLALAGQADGAVLFQSPYTVLGREARRGFLALAEQKEVGLLTNSLASTPNPPAFSAYLWDRTSLAQSGLNIYEYQSRDSIHGKAAFIGSRLTAVGSWNLDERSIYIDTEVMLVIDSAPFQQQMLSALSDITSQCLIVGPDGEYLPGDVEALEVPLGKRVLYHGLSVLTHLLSFLI